GRDLTTWRSGSRAEARARGRWGSDSADDHQAVALRIAQPEQWRHRVSHAADLRIHVHATGLQLGVEGIDLIGLQADTRLAVARRRSRGRRGEGDRGDRVARRHLDPPETVAEGHVGALLEAERL